MNLCASPLSSFRLLLFSLLACFAGVLGAQGQQSSAGLPEFENEFFNDFSGSVSNSQKIEISRNLRLASETSQIHAMIVVIKKVADYPGLPQDVHAMALQLARERKVGSQKTHQGLLALFALEDRKFTVAHSANLSPKLAESIRDTFNGRVRAKLRDAQTGQALVFASEDFASLLPKAGAAPKPGASVAHAPTSPAHRPAFAGSPDPGKPEPQKEAGLGWGTWIAIIVGGYVLISLLGRLFSGGGGGGLGGGGAPGWGGLLGGLLGGGLLGYWLGNSSSNASESHHDGGGTAGAAGGSAPDGESDSSDSGGFDSFGGGDFGGDSSGGGGSDGDW
jgi:hypothetical protein